MLSKMQNSLVLILRDLENVLNDLKISSAICDPYPTNIPNMKPG